MLFLKISDSDSSTSEMDCEPAVISDGRDSSGSGHSGTTRRRHRVTTSDGSTLQDDSDSEYSDGSESERKHKKKFQYAMDFRSKRRQYTPKLNTTPHTKCRHQVERIECPQCAGNQIGTLTTQISHDKAQTNKADKAAVMTVYNVTRRSIELYSPPAENDGQNSELVEKSSEQQNLDQETGMEVSESSRDRRQFVGNVQSRHGENSGPVKDNGVQRSSEGNTLGSTYVISRSEKCKEEECNRPTERQLVSRTEKDCGGETDSRTLGHWDIKPVPYCQRGSVHRTDTSANQRNNEDGTTLSLPSNQGKSVQTAKSSISVNKINQEDQNTCVSSGKQQYLGALCDNTVVYEGRWTPQAKSYHIAMTDTSEVEETTTTEVDSDFGSEDSGNEADVSFMSEWGDNQPIRGHNDPESLDLVTRGKETPKRKIGPLSESSLRPVNHMTQNIAKNLGMAKSVTPKHKVHLDVQGFLSLPNSPTALIKSPLQKVSSPSPSHFKQLFDKLKASAGRERTSSSPTLDYSHTPPSIPGRPVFRTPTTVPRVQMRKRLDMNHNEDVGVLVIDDLLEKEMQSKRPVKQLIEAKSKSQEKAVSYCQGQTKETKLTSPSAKIRKKVQTFNQLFAEMKRPPSERSNAVKLQGKKIGNQDLGALKSLSDKHKVNQWHKCSSLSHRLESAQCSDSQICTAVESEKEIESSVKKQVAQQKESSDAQNAAASSPVRSASQCRITSTPCKTNSPMPNMLDISMIQGPETDTHGEKCGKRRQEDLQGTDSHQPKKVTDYHQSKKVSVVKLPKLAGDQLKNMYCYDAQLGNSSGKSSHSDKEVPSVKIQHQSNNGNKNKLETMYKDSCTTAEKHTGVTDGKRRTQSTTPTSQKFGEASQHSDSKKVSVPPSDETTPKRNHSRERKKNAHTPKGIESMCTLNIKFAVNSVFEKKN